VEQSLTINTLQRREKEFVNDLLDLIKSEKLGAVLLVSGLDPINRTDAQMAYVFVLNTDR